MPPSGSDGACTSNDRDAGTGSLPVLPRRAVPAVFREPYILAGYRRSNCSYLDCVRYAFVPHNDCGNFWTIFLPLFVWLSWLYYLSFELDLTDPHFYPLLCFWAGSCSYAFFSSIAHLLGNKSLTVRSVCFILDYLGIAMYCLGAGMATFFYEQMTGSIWYQYKWPVLIVEAALAITAVLLCAISRFFCLRHRFTIRSVAFLFPYIAYVLPSVQRFGVCITTGQDCIHETLYLHLFGFVNVVAMMFFFVSKIPERFAPGRFDYVGQSHQLHHVLGVTLTTSQMMMIPTDALIHRDTLSAWPDYRPDFSSTILLYVLVQVCGLVCVGVFGLLVWARVLISNKAEVVKDVIKREKCD